jgi:4'-phosphopantetheinyl transferase EntD
MVNHTNRAIVERLNGMLDSEIMSAVQPASSEKMPANASEEHACAYFSPSRRAEFITGRACARAALMDLGYPDAKLTANKEGIPEWPSGTIGSITHSKGLCGAVAAQSSQFSCLGLDFEQAGRLSSAAAKRVVHPIEEDFANTQPDAPTILFSLKEAFFKAQFPRWQKHANFQDIALTVNLSKEDAELRYINQDLDELSDASFHFRVAQQDKLVVALCWVAAKP